MRSSVFAPIAFAAASSHEGEFDTSTTTEAPLLALADRSRLDLILKNRILK